MPAFLIVITGKLATMQQVGDSGWDGLTSKVFWDLYRTDLSPRPKEAGAI